MFEKTKISLRKWFIAIWLVTNHKTGLSSYQLANDIEVTQKTAWYMLHKIRHAMRLANENFLEETVEIDETLVGGRNGNRHWDKKVPHSQGRSHKDKNYPPDTVPPPDHGRGLDRRRDEGSIPR